jgi:hypothetical protein
VQLGLFPEPVVIEIVQVLANRDRTVTLGSNLPGDEDSLWSSSLKGMKHGTQIGHYTTSMGSKGHKHLA